MNESMIKPRMTRQRKTILETVREIMNHPSADTVYERVRERLPRISLATVYRNLELLSDQGLLLKVESATNRMRFDHNTHAHHHVTCQACGRADDVPAEWAEIRSSEPHPMGYQILGHRIEFLGICPACLAKGPSPAGRPRRRRAR